MKIPLLLRTQARPLSPPTRLLFSIITFFKAGHRGTTDSTQARPLSPPTRLLFSIITFFKAGHRGTTDSTQPRPLSPPTRRRWVPFFVLFSREIHRFLKVLAQTVFIPVVNSSIYLLIFGVSLGRDIKALEGFSYLEFLIPGLIMLVCMNNSYQNSSSSLLGMKFGKDIMDLKASPLTVQQMIWAMSFGGLCRGLFVGFIVFLTGEFFYYFHTARFLWPAHPVYLLVFCSIGGLAFTKLGIAVAFWAKSFDHVSAIGGFIIVPLISLGGVFFSLNNLSPFWIKVSYFNPLLYFVNGVRYGMLGVSDVPIGIAFFISLFGLLFFHLVAIWTLKKGSYQPW